MKEFNGFTAVRPNGDIILFEFVYDLDYGTTLCRALRYGGGSDIKVIAQGVTLCSLDDVFNYDAGSKEAFTRALRNLTPSRSERQIYWDKYFSIFDGNA